MIKKIILLSLMALAITACKEETEQITTSDPTDNSNQEDTITTAPSIVLKSENKPIVFDYTSTGCPGCGSWGAPTFENLSNQLGNKIVPIAVHIKYGDPMITDESNALGQNRTGQYFTPQLWINNTNSTLLNGGRIDATGSLAALNQNITTFQGEAVQISLGVSHAIQDDKINIRYKHKSETDLDGDYFVSLYVMENHLFHNQASGAVNPFEHNYVIRTSSSGAFGSKIESQNLADNQEFEDTINLDIDPTWDKSNLYVTAIIWKNNGDKFIVINANNDLVK